MKNKTNSKNKEIEEDHELFKKIMMECEKLRWRKVNDYGLTYNEYGLIGLLVKLGDKYGRAKSLFNKQQQNIKPSFEPMRDSLIDLINYSIMAVMEVDRNESKTNIS